MRGVPASRRMSREACRQFRASGQCRYGDSCRFAHYTEATGPGGYAAPSAQPPISHHGQYYHGQSFFAQQQGFYTGVSGSQHNMGYGNRVWNPPAAQGRWSGVSQTRTYTNYQHQHQSREPMAGDRTPGLFERLWARAQVPSLDPSKEVSVSIMTYNLLADALAHEHYSYLYQGTPHLHIDWHNHRWPLAVKEIQHWNPDVLCLQEVDQYEMIEASLAQLGYQGLYARRSGTRTDGCATFWRMDRVSLVDSQVVQMSDHNLKDNVALLVALQCHGADSEDSAADAAGRGRLVVANTHVLFNQKRGDIKVGQIRTALKSALALAHQAFPTAIHQTGIVYTGDFNSSPGSGVYNFLSQGWLNLSQHHRRDISGQKEGYGYSQYQQDLRRGRAPLTGYVPPPPSPAPVGPSVTEAGTDALDTSSPDSDSDTPAPAAHGSGVQLVGTGVDATGVAASSAAVTVQRTQEDGTQVTARATQVTAVLQQFKGPHPPTAYAPWDDVDDRTLQGVAPVAAADVTVTQSTTVVQTPSGADSTIRADSSTDPAGLPSQQKRQRVVEQSTAQIQSVVSLQQQAQVMSRVIVWEEEELEAALGSEMAQQLLANICLDSSGGSAGHRKAEYERAVRKARTEQSQQGLLVARHPLSLQSAHVAVTGAEPTFTSCHRRCIETLDYIWFTPGGCPEQPPNESPQGGQAVETGMSSSSSGDASQQVVMRALRVLAAPTSTRFTRGMPNRSWPSDHVSQMAEFAVLRS